MPLSSFAVGYSLYVFLSLVLILVLRTLKSTWMPPPAGTRQPTGFGAAISLPQAARRFLSHLCPQLLLCATIALWSLRIWLNHWSWQDAAILAGLLLCWPFLEWSTHAFLLHWKPPRILGGREPIFVITHRTHHQNPWDAKTGLAVPYVIAFYVFSPPMLTTLLFALPQAMTCAAMLTTLLLNYEWLHFLIHTSYQPRSRLYKRLWRHHRLHHFKSEKHWYGVTATLADAVLRSNPKEKDIPHSDSCLWLATTHSEPEVPDNCAHPIGTEAADVPLSSEQSDDTTVVTA